MKTQDQLEMPAQLLSVACALIAVIHFYNCSGKADFVLLGFVVLCALPWMGGIFESVSKHGVKYRQQGSTSVPLAGLVALVNANPASAFSQMAIQEKKVLATLWKYQRIHFQNRVDQRWTFTVGTGSPEYMEFSIGVLLLIDKKYAAVAPSGQIMLTETGYSFCQVHDVEISVWPATYDKFSN
jgi:hypothetical protein